MRLGTFYRNLMWKKIGIEANGARVLDVGGYDGYWLSKQSAKNKICVDLNPKEKYTNVTYVKANALSLPFEDGYFDQVFAFDIIEHVENDKQLLSELLRVTKVGGEIVLSTPHKQISIFPPFLTDWVSKKWGHERVNGYLENEIKQILPEGNAATFLYLREPFFRIFYLPLRFLWGMSNRIATPIVRAIAYIDAIFLKGNNGHILIFITRKPQ